MTKVKDYLSSKEREIFLLTFKLFDALEEVKTWKDRNVITEEEYQNILKCDEFGMKAMESIIRRQNKSALKTLHNSVNNIHVTLTNSFGVYQYMSEKSADEKASYEKNKEFFDLVENVMHVNCKNCNTYCEDCDFYKQFETLYIQDMGDDFGNCRFAYKK